jgi:hypothetical protein
LQEYAPRMHGVPPYLDFADSATSPAVKPPIFC